MITSTGAVTIRVWPNPSACRQARQGISEFCAARELEHLTDDATLLTSEIVSNAIRGATSVITVVGTESERVLVVAVRGEQPDHAQLKAKSQDLLDEHGRGLLVVDHLADDWGSTQHAGMTTVWFRLS